MERRLFFYLNVRLMSVSWAYMSRLAYKLWAYLLIKTMTFGFLFHLPLLCNSCRGRQTERDETSLIAWKFTWKTNWFENTQSTSSYINMKSGRLPKTKRVNRLFKLDSTTLEKRKKDFMSLIFSLCCSIAKGVAHSV